MFVNYMNIDMWNIFNFEKIMKIIHFVKFLRFHLEEIIF